MKFRKKPTDADIAMSTKQKFGARKTTWTGNHFQVQ